MTLRAVVSGATVPGWKFHPTSWTVQTTCTVLTVRKLILSCHIQVVAHGAGLVQRAAQGTVVAHRADVTCGVVSGGRSVGLEYAVVTCKTNIQTNNFHFDLDKMQNNPLQEISVLLLFTDPLYSFL